MPGPGQSWRWDWTNKGPLLSSAELWRDGQVLLIESSNHYIISEMHLTSLAKMARMADFILCIFYRMKKGHCWLASVIFSMQIYS